MFSRVRISFTVFAAEPFTRFYLNTFTTKRDIMNAIKITEVGYQTDLAKALRQVSVVGRRYQCGYGRVGPGRVECDRLGSGDVSLKTTSRKNQVENSELR